MTLALYGKSRKRQAGLAGLGLFAVTIGAIAALWVVTLAFAHHLSGDIITPTCQDDRWKVQVLTGDWQGYREAVLTTSGTTPISMEFDPFVYKGSTNVFIVNASGNAPVDTTGMVQQYTGTWESPVNVGKVADFNVDADDTVLVNEDWIGYAHGDVIRWDDELMYVSTVSGENMTVIRGWAYSTATSHSDGDDGDDIFRWQRGSLDTGNSPNTISWNLHFDGTHCKGRVNVTKHVVNVSGDQTDFDISLSSPATNFTVKDETTSAYKDITVGDQTITEQAEPGYTTIGWARIFPGDGRVCPSQMPTSTGSVVQSFGVGNVINLNVQDNYTYEVCFYNELQQITIKAWKVVCNTEADLPNWGDGAADISATTAATWVTGHPACHFVDGWEFEWGAEPVNNPGNDDNDTALTDFDTATSGSTASSQTPAMATIDIGQFQNLWAREKLQSDYIPFSGDTSAPRDDVSAEFYCSADVLNYDNWERIEDTDGQHDLTAGKTYHCVGFNALATRDVDVCKVVEGNGDGVIDGGEFQFTASWPDHSENFTLEAYEPNPDTDGALGEEVCKTFSIPEDATLHVFEWEGDWLPGGNLPGTWNGQASGYPHSSLSGQHPQGTADVDPNTSSVTFTNKADPRTGHIHNVKVVVNDPTDTTEFHADVHNYLDDTQDYVADFTQQTPDVQEAVPGHYGATEQDPGPGYHYITTLVGTYDDGEIGCPALEALDHLEVSELDQVPGTELEAGEDIVFCHYNLRLAKVVLTKFENIPGANTWNFSSTSSDIPSGDLIYNFSAATTTETREWYITPGDFSFTETEAMTPLCSQRTVPVFSGDYETLVLSSSSPITAGDVQTSGASSATGNFSVAPGGTAYVAYVNRTCGSVLSASNIIVRKFQDVNGDFDANDASEGPLSGWHITITGTRGDALGKVYGLDTDGSGVAAFLGVETAPGPSAKLLRSRTRSSAPSTPVGIAPARPDRRLTAPPPAQPGRVCRRPGQTLKVDFFNQPKGKITVVKTVTDNVGNVGVAGWEFDLDGCGVHKDGTTDGSGTIVWTNLLPCANYIVTEVDANTNGFSVTPSATQVVNIGPGDEEAVTFHNRRDPGTTPGTGETPTNTPTATNTPTTRRDSDGDGDRHADR